MATEQKNNEETTFSKNSVITLSRRAGVKSISQCGVEKVKDILNNKIKNMCEKLAVFYGPKSGKTITKKVVLQFLESEGVNLTVKE